MYVFIFRINIYSYADAAVKADGIASVCVIVAISFTKFPPGKITTN